MSSSRPRANAAGAGIVAPLLSDAMGMHEPTITRVEFNDHGAKTRMTLSDGPYPAGRDHAEAGWTAAFNNSPRSSPDSNPDRTSADQPTLVEMACSRSCRAVTSRSPEYTSTATRLPGSLVHNRQRPSGRRRCRYRHRRGSPGWCAGRAGGWVGEVAEVAPGQRCGDDDQ